MLLLCSFKSYQMTLSDNGKDNTLPSHIFLLHNKAEALNLLQGASYHELYMNFKQFSFPPQLFGSPGSQKVNSQGVQSVQIQTPSSSISLPPSQILVTPILAKPDRRQPSFSCEATEAKCPPCSWQNFSAAVHLVCLVLQRQQWSPCFSQPSSQASTHLSLMQAEPKRRFFCLITSPELCFINQD